MYLFYYTTLKPKHSWDLKTTFLTEYFFPLIKTYSCHFPADANFWCHFMLFPNSANFLMVFDKSLDLNDLANEKYCSVPEPPIVWAHIVALGYTSPL